MGAAAVGDNIQLNEKLYKYAKPKRGVTYLSRFIIIKYMVVNPLYIDVAFL